MEKTMIYYIAYMWIQIYRYAYNVYANKIWQYKKFKKNLCLGYLNLSEGMWALSTVDTIFLLSTGEKHK